MEELKEILKTAKRILFVTGAGISVESGLPTYRGEGGLYSSSEEDMYLEMSGETFQKSPEKTWAHLFMMEKLCRGCEPNQSHKILSKLQEKYEVWISTQNVDGYHQKSGPLQVLPLHGTLNEVFCPSCLWKSRIENFETLEKPLPKCPECKNDTRPNVVLFDEMLDSSLMEVYEEQLNTGFDVVFFVGTTASFLYITNIVWEMKETGGKTVEINPLETPISEDVDFSFREKSTECLTQLFEGLI